MTSPTPVKLQFAAPRRGKPPKHLADLSAEELATALEEFGLSAYRGKQLGTHYFDHLTRDADDLTDLSANLRAELVYILLPEFATPLLIFNRDVHNIVKHLSKF